MGPQRLSHGVEPTHALLTYPKAPWGCSCFQSPNSTATAPPTASHPSRKSEPPKHRISRSSLPTNTLEAVLIKARVRIRYHLSPSSLPGRAPKTPLPKVSLLTSNDPFLGFCTSLRCWKWVVWFLPILLATLPTAPA